VREALAAAGSRSTGLDIACCEGWFCHRLLDWGASRVVGVDIREVNVRRARLVAAQLDLGPEQLEVRLGDVHSLDPAGLGVFDVVLVLGLIYHLEDPVGALRVARRLTRGLCVIETQLTRQDEPIPWVSPPDYEMRSVPSFAANLEVDSEASPLASAPGVLSLVPNRAAVEQMAAAAGFARVEAVEPPPGADQRFVSGDRGVFLASV
jgi:tRNA (mo5U34)-methyltransferase